MTDNDKLVCEKCGECWKGSDLELALMSKTGGGWSDAEHVDCGGVVHLLGGETITPPRIHHGFCDAPDTFDSVIEVDEDIWLHVYIDENEADPWVKDALQPGSVLGWIYLLPADGFELDDLVGQGIILYDYEFTMVSPELVCDYWTIGQDTIEDPIYLVAMLGGTVEYDSIIIEVAIGFPFPEVVGVNVIIPEGRSEVYLSEIGEFNNLDHYARAYHHAVEAAEDGHDLARDLVASDEGPDFGSGGAS